MSFFSFARGVLLRRAFITTRSYLVVRGVISKLFSFLVLYNFKNCEIEVRANWKDSGGKTLNRYLIEAKTDVCKIIGTVFRCRLDADNFKKMTCCFDISDHQIRWLRHPTRWARPPPPSVWQMSQVLHFFLF